jgi:flagellar basal-body rod protein FlgF
MGSEIYPAMSGGMRALKMLDALSNNLANVNTTGFKADRLVFELQAPEQASSSDASAAEMRLAEAWSALDSEATDFSQGNVRPSGGNTDFAINGAGFFQVEDSEGTTFLTRDGSFQLDSENYLATRGGLRVLGADDLPLQIKQGDFVVGPDGAVRVNGQLAGTMGVVDIADRTGLSKQGANLFAMAKDSEMVVAGGKIQQGHLEGSNVQPIQALTQMIAINRYYEAFTKSLENSSSLDKQLNSSVGKLRG